MTDHEAAAPTPLADPNIPADQGLSTLGLLMQLGGTVFAAVGSLALLFFVFVPYGPGEKGLMLLALALSVARSAFHRNAGTVLLYGRRTLDGQANPIGGVRSYIFAALLHSVAVTAIFQYGLHLPKMAVLGVGAGLMVWPLLLTAVFSMPRFKRFGNEIPLSEDKGFEGASIVMTVLGMCGVLGSGAFVLMMLDSAGPLMSRGPGVLMLVGLVKLFIRSILHVRAGLSGLRETSLDLSVERANRYANFGVIASFGASAALLIVSVSGMFNIFGIAMVAGVCWILMAWPLIIRRFFSDRQFSDLLAGDDASTHRRAPDAGLTGLGWFLLAHAALGATMLLPQLIGGSDVTATRWTILLGPIATKSLWFNAGIITFQAWAGYELICMSKPSRVVAMAYAVICGALTVWLTYPMLAKLSHLGRDLSPDAVLMFIPLAISFVIPIATLVLVNRTIAPTARARFVSIKPPETPA